MRTEKSISEIQLRTELKSGTTTASGNGVNVAQKRLLLVDDDQGIRELVSQVLRIGGYSISEASNGAEALALFSKSRFDLVITDFEMPVMKGDELVDKVRRLVPGQRIIMASGTRPKLRDRLPKVDVCVDKPFQIADLLSAVHHVLLPQDQARAQNSKDDQDR
jgi:CheY-like chemotaxis protein